MKRLIIRNGLSHTQTDYNEKREQLISEFNELKELHKLRIQEIFNNEDMTSRDKIMELRYEKALLLEEYENYSKAIEEYSAEANDYEGCFDNVESECYLAEDYAFGENVESDNDIELNFSNNQDFETSF